MTSALLSEQDGSETKMATRLKQESPRDLSEMATGLNKLGAHFLAVALTVLAGVFTFALSPALARRPAFAQSPEAPPPKAAAPTNVRLTIEVSGGDKELPVENASVYLKYVVVHLIKDKKIELNVKTNHEGTAHIPDAPMGKVLIQVVAEGWRTYGKTFEVTEPKQTIKVHLEKPPKWY